MKPTLKPAPPFLSSSLSLPLRQRLGRLVGAPKPAPFLGHVDGVDATGTLRGWAVDSQTGSGGLALGLYLGGTLVEATTARLPRDDVAQATGHSAYCGFAFPIDDGLFASASTRASTHASTHGGGLSVRTLGGVVATIGTWQPPCPTDDAADEDTAPDKGKDKGKGKDQGKAKNQAAALRTYLAPDLRALAKAVAGISPKTKPPAPHSPPPLAAHSALFATDSPPPDTAPSGLPGYLDFMRYRFCLDDHFDVRPTLPAWDRFVHHYVGTYRQGSGLRVPLSQDVITYLNTPLVMGPQTHTLTRAIWGRLAGRADVLGRLDLNTRDSMIDALYWWACHEAPHLGVEDCLVPDAMAAHLGALPPSQRGRAFGMSNFALRFFNETPALHGLDVATAAGRKTLTLVLLVKAGARPDLLRYLPQDTVEGLLAPGPNGGASDFDQFVRDLDPDCDPDLDSDLGLGLDPLPRARLAQAWRRQKFDLDRRAFLTRTADGHRLDAAGLPRPKGKRVDVQLIGPLQKASGLGQAARLSASILGHTDRSLRAVDFDLDNPAPEGFSTDTQTQSLGPARVNLIHLNAESVPLAFAFQPDVFSDAYNIGYFFWELDKPAHCHHLALDLLDEVWVSTDYGVQIYQPNPQGRPVHNVGMCFEDLPPTPRRAARDWMNARLGLGHRHFVCLAAFDSFSYVQRKNPLGVLAAFQTAFADVPQARLVIKTQNRGSVQDEAQLHIWDAVDAIVARDPRIVVMNETLTYRDVMRLKAGSDCYVSLHTSEGWGFGMMEAMNLGVPVVCSNYSGNLDFCRPDTAWLVDCPETPLQPKDYIFVRKGSHWGAPDVDHAARQLRAVFDDPAARAAKTKAAARFVQDRFSAAAVAKRYDARLQTILSQLS